MPFWWISGLWQPTTWIYYLSTSCYFAPRSPQPTLWAEPLITNPKCLLHICILMYACVQVCMCTCIYMGVGDHPCSDAHTCINTDITQSHMDTSTHSNIQPYTSKYCSFLLPLQQPDDFLITTHAISCHLYKWFPVQDFTTVAYIPISNHNTTWSSLTNHNPSYSNNNQLMLFKFRLAGE